MRALFHTILAVGVVVVVVVSEALAACGSNPAKTCQGRCGGGGVGLCYCDSECDLNGDCCPDFEECCPQCVNPCVGKECGPDGCGGSCGSCGFGPQWSCVSGKCVCTPYCAGAVCGKDGCGGLCGSCPAGQVCAGGKCVPSTCTPNCMARQCGDGGCPDQPDACGVCLPGQTCSIWGQCQGCATQCTGKECGDDGCGGSCGTCPTPKVCNASGQCVTPPCVPQCVGKQCGDDGCGGSCGTCSPGKTCDATGACVEAVADPGTPESGLPVEPSIPKEDFVSDEAPSGDAAIADHSASYEVVVIADVGTNTSCPSGYHWSYGRCVATPGGGSEGKASGGGCGAQGTVTWWSLLLLLVPMGWFLVPRLHRRAAPSRAVR